MFWDAGRDCAVSESLCRLQRDVKYGKYKPETGDVPEYMFITKCHHKVVLNWIQIMPDVRCQVESIENDSIGIEDKENLRQTNLFILLSLIE